MTKRLTAEPAHIRRTAAAVLRAVADQLETSGVELVTPDGLRVIADNVEQAEA